MGFPNIAALVDAEIAGQRNYFSFRKVPAVSTGIGSWYDYSMCPGNPAPQYYAAAPLTAQVLSRSADGGMPHGLDVSPSAKYLRRIMFTTNAAGGVPQWFILLDYLLFYPFVDMGTADEQVMTNVQTLPRYEDGEGVKMMAVLVAPHGLISDSFRVTYTNSEGETGRITPLHTMTNLSSVNGTILNSQRSGVGLFGPFLSLQNGDHGVRSIESVQCTAGTDVGLFTMVLVKPIASLQLREITAPVEKDFLLDDKVLPVIFDDAYLNFISCPGGSFIASAVNGIIETVWT